MATIQGIYVALFGRPADPIGLDYFNKATGNGANLSAIGDLATTPEYQSRFEGMDNVEIVTAIYQSLFARNPEQVGLTFFVDHLTAGTLTVNNIAIAILDGAQGPDLDIVRNKIEAANVFTKAIDTPDELAAYRGDKAADVGRSVITPVTADDDTVFSADDANAALATLVNASADFVLTAGYDTADTKSAFTDGGPGDTGDKANFRFTDASETIVATSATLGRFDSLVDGATTDSDRLELALTANVIFGATKNIEILEINANTDTASTISMALVTGATTLDINGLLNGSLTVSDIYNTGITMVDGSGLVSAEPGNGFTVDFSAASGAIGRQITGSAASDTLTGADGKDTLTGGSGDDVLFGKGGEDSVSGGAGNDNIDGGTGNDTIDGGAGNDQIRGDAGNDILDGGADMDQVFGGAGDDVINGGDGIDAITGDEGSDTLRGGAGMDQILLTKDFSIGLFVPDGTTDTVVFESTASGNGADSIGLFEVAGTGPDRLDVSAFLGEPVAFQALPTKSLGVAAAGFDGSAFNVFALALDTNVDTIEELTAAIGNGAGDLKLAPNDHVVIALDDGDNTRMYFVTTDALGEATDVSIVALVGDVVTAQLTALNFL